MAALPVEVAPDSDVFVPFNVDTGAQGGMLPADVAAALCAPEGIRITGAIEDSLEDRATPVASAVFRAALPVMRRTPAAPARSPALPGAIARAPR